MIQKETPRFSLEQKLGFVSIFVVLIIMFSVIWSLRFLSQGMMTAFAQETIGAVPTYSFDFKGYDALELK